MVSKKYTRTNAKAKDGDDIIIPYGINGHHDLRLAGVRAQEIGKKGANLAKQRLNNLIKNEKLTIRQVGQSHGRPVVDIKVGNKSVNKAMRKLGYTNKGN